MTNLCVLSPPSLATIWGHYSLRDDSGRVPKGFEENVAEYFDVADDTTSTWLTGLPDL